MKPDETTTEEKGSRSYWGFVLWPLVILLLYPLSYGPALRAAHNRIIRASVLHVYYPLLRVTYVARLDRPFGMYLHLWVPEMYSEDGAWIPTSRSGGFPTDADPTAKKAP